MLVKNQFGKEYKLQPCRSDQLSIIGHFAIHPPLEMLEDGTARINPKLKTEIEITHIPTGAKFSEILKIFGVKISKRNLMGLARHFERLGNPGILSINDATSKLLKSHLEDMIRNIPVEFKC
jgi:hypothetical protein